MKQQTLRSVMGTAVALASLAVTGAAFAGGPELSARLPGANVTVALPSDRIEVGSNAPFRISVEPVDGKPAPVEVRARLGMPMMHHWVTDEERQAFAPELAFDFSDHLHMDSAIPMYGLYRLRVWLGYANGPDATTAIDFKVMADEPLNPEIVQ